MRVLMDNMVFGDTRLLPANWVAPVGRLSSGYWTVRVLSRLASNLAEKGAPLP
jgi:hypothetical protein